MLKNYDPKPFNRKLKFFSTKKRFFSNFLLAELSVDQLVNLRRREALAYEIDVFQQAAKDKQSNIKH